MTLLAYIDEGPLTSERRASLLALARENAKNALKTLEAANTDIEIFSAQPGAALAAYRLENFEVAKDLAEKTLALATTHQSNWNFGNAIHLSHSVLGMLAFDRGDLDLALLELAKAGATPGSPQLNSFGPTTLLADALLSKGHSDAVLAYLDQCRFFWKNGLAVLDAWVEKISAGEIPSWTLYVYR